MFRNWPHATALSDQRIQRIPFAFNVTSILPESQQVELQFPMFIQGQILLLCALDCCHKCKNINLKVFSVLDHNYLYINLLSH